MSVGVAQPAEQALQGRVVGVVEGPQPVLQVGQTERTGEDGRVALGVGAHHAATRAHLAPRVLEVVPAAIHVDEDARERRGEDGGPVLVQVAVEIAREGVGVAVGEGLEPRLRVVVTRDVGQRQGAVVGHAHQDGCRPLRDRMANDGEGEVHRVR